MPWTAEQQRQYNRSYYAARREELLVRNRAWKAAHRETHRAGSARWQRENPEASRRLKAAYKLRHPERAALANRRTSTDALASHAARERVRQRGQRPSGPVLALYQAVRRIDVLFCWWCDDVVPHRLRHLDHLTPLSRGGAHEVQNLAGACRGCNLRKGAQPAEVFARRVEK